jgi:hypothetical protein
LLNAFYVFCHETARVNSALPILAKVVVLVGLKLHERVEGVAAATAVQGAAVEVGHALSRIELTPEKIEFQRYLPLPGIERIQILYL